MRIQSGRARGERRLSHRSRRGDRLSPGESRVLAVQGTPASSLTWTTSDPAIATIDAGVLRAGQQPGAVVITATSATGATALTHAVVQLPQSVPSTYRITLVYGADVPDAWKPAFQWAATLATVGVLLDLGYPTAWYAAGL